MRRERGWKGKEKEGVGMMNGQCGAQLDLCIDPLRPTPKWRHPNCCGGLAGSITV